MPEAQQPRRVRNPPKSMSSFVVSRRLKTARLHERFFAVLGAILVQSTLPTVAAESTPVLERFRADREVRALMGPYSALARTGDTIHSFPLEPGRIPDPDTPMIGVLRSGTGTGGSVSQGTAYLYEQFATGRLEGHRYGHPDSERALRDAIWALEDPAQRPVQGSNVFLKQAVQRFGSLEAAREPDTGGRVRVISLIPDTRGEKLHGYFGKSAVVYGKGPSDVGPVRVPVFTGPVESDQFVGAPGAWGGPAGVLFAGPGVPTSTVGESAGGGGSSADGAVGVSVGGGQPSPPQPPPTARVPESGGGGALLLTLALLCVGAFWVWTRQAAA